MAIVKYVKGMSLYVGMWINAGKTLRHGFAGAACQIEAVKLFSVQVSTKQYLGPPHSSLIRRTSVQWICDTEEEAMHMMRKSLEFAHESAKHEAALKERIDMAELVATNAALLGPEYTGVGPAPIRPTSYMASVHSHQFGVATQN